MDSVDKNSSKQQIEHTLRVCITEDGQITKEWTDTFPSFEAATLVLESRAQLISDSVTDHHTKERYGRFMSGLKEAMLDARTNSDGFGYIEVSEPSFTEHYQINISHNGVAQLNEQQRETLLRMLEHASINHLKRMLNL